MAERLLEDAYRKGEQQREQVRGDVETARERSRRDAERAKQRARQEHEVRTGGASGGPGGTNPPQTA